MKLMKFMSSLIRLCWALLILLTVTYQPNAQTRWYRFMGPDNDFSINFPSVPKHETHLNSSSQQPLELYTFVFNRHLLNIGYKDLVPAPHTLKQRESALSGAIKSEIDWIKKLGGQLLKQQRLANGGIQFDFTSRLDDGTPTINRDRIYIYGGRYYQLRCLSISQLGLDESIANQFFNSFQFTIAVSPARAKPILKTNRVTN